MLNFQSVNQSLIHYRNFNGNRTNSHSSEAAVLKQEVNSNTNERYIHADAANLKVMQYLS